MKLSRIYTVILLIIFGFIFIKEYRTKEQRSTLVSFTGETLGTTYNVKYLDDRRRVFQRSIDSLLIDFDLVLSTYKKQSLISAFNHSGAIKLDEKYFYPVLVSSEKIYELSNGAFDPTVGPLIDLWGFGPKPGGIPDSSQVLQVKEMIGFDQLRFDQDSLIATQSGINLNFNANAKGYAVDLVAELLERKGISNLWVEIGGEVVCRGKNEEKIVWRAGIENPETEQTDIAASLPILNQAIATSGNYRQYIERDGKRLGHSINPNTGYPEMNNLLSVSIITTNCMEADALATACMILGLDESKKLIENRPDTEGVFLYSGKDDMESWTSTGLIGKVQF